MKSQWACTTCKSKFGTMAAFKYHDCEPKPFKRKPREDAALREALSHKDPQTTTGHAAGSDQKSVH